MKRQITAMTLIAAVLMVMPFQAYAASAKETVETSVNKVLKTLGDPAFKAKPKDVKITEIGNIIGEVFDFTELSKRTLGREWKKMKPEQQKEFAELFKELLQGVYADRLLAYTDQKIEFGKEIELKKGRAEVQSNIVLSDGTKVPIFYRLTDKSGDWKTYDLIIEGVSLVKNYRSQFREIIAKESPDKLLEILRDKVSKG
ncbi:MAG: ABC transporter substrate-binding protein [Desulfobacterales bacterium]|jgi:phospholipid transport system substrate-binding protein